MIRILHLEDDASDVQLVRELLRESWQPCEIVPVVTQSDYLTALKREEFDLILSDFTLVSFTGLDALRLARAYAPETPFVFLSGTIGEDRAIDAVRQGAADYVLKDRMKRLPSVIDRVLAEREERRARHAAEQSQGRLVSILDHTPDFVAMAKPDGSLIYLNPAGRALAGWRPDEPLSTHPLSHFFTPDAAQRLASVGIPTATHDGTWSGETELRTRDGNVIPASVVIIAHRDASGQLSHLSATVRDISALKKAEAHLKEREATLFANNERFELVTRATNDAIWDWNLRSNQLWWNDGFEVLFGHSRTAVPPDLASWTNFLHPDDREQAIKSLHNAVDGNQSTWIEEYRFQRADGTYADVLDRGFIMRDSQGQAYRMLGSMQDITTRKESQTRIREQAELINQARDAIILTDPQNRITFWNEGAQRLMGWATDEAIGRTFEQIFGVFSSPQPQELRRASDRRGGWQTELRCTSKESRTLTLEAHVTLIADADGKTKARLYIVSDITEKKALQEQLLRVQRIESIGMLAAGIAHDINNVLTPILMAAPMLRRGNSNPLELRLLQTLETSAERGAALVRQILAFAQGTVGEPRAMPLKHLLRDIIEVIEETFPKTIKLDLDFPNEVWSVVANPTQIHQVLLNLCVNARDAMVAGGTLSLRTANARLDDSTAATILGARAGAFVVIEVADTGTGITPEVLARIWEPFFTTKPQGKGTGLGLSTVRGIVQNHHGFIELETRQGIGTKFRVYLPAVDASPEELAKTAPNEAPPRGEGELILLVEDDHTNREVTQATLARHGYRVITAKDGVEALAQFTPRADEVQLVVCDMDLPNQSGITLTRGLQRLKPDLKIIIVSGLSATEGRKPSESAPPFDRFLAKPFKPEALLNQIHTSLHAT